MTDAFMIDSAETPEVALAANGTSWENVQRYVGISHRPVLAELPDEPGTYVGAYWDAAGARVLSTHPNTFGLTQADALNELRGYLRAKT